MKKIIKLLTNKILITIFFFLLQLAIIGVVIAFLSTESIWFYGSMGVLSVIVCIFITSQDTNPGYKLAWVVPILLFPLFGGMLYLSMGRQPKMKKKLQRKMIRVQADTEKLLSEVGIKTEDTENSLKPQEQKIHNLITFNSGYTMYGNNKTTYYNLGEKFYAALIEDLKKAEKFIFLEFFIIEEGKFWNDILEVLRAKVLEGVDVRVIYDDFGCLFTLPAKYYKTLSSHGIKCLVFNKVKAAFDIRLNNRTHRKIAVIDSKVAFTGGLNIADEYINEVVRYGHWKDTGMKFEGKASWSFTVMFLRTWMLLEDGETDYHTFLPEIDQNEIIDESLGYVQPLSCGPGINQQLLENTFMQMISNANQYVYINTPYLILDNEFVTVLCNAAKSGVDVRITMPHIPDKKIVFLVSRSFYPQLLKAGVKIYEYLPGFVHAKSIVCDGNVAFIGTCNLDYRSFYLHFECGAIIYNTPSIADMQADYLKTLENCKELTYAEANNVNFFVRIARSILKLFAPLM